MNITDPKATRETVYPYAEPGDLIYVEGEHYLLTDFIDCTAKYKWCLAEGGLTVNRCHTVVPQSIFFLHTIIRKSDPRYPELLKTAIRPRTWRGVDYMDQHKEVGP
jgi:hypothetical protein